MRIPAMSRILRSSNLYGKIIVFEYKYSYISKQCDFSKQTFCIMVPQRQIETPPSDRQQKSKFQNIKLFSLQSIQNDPCIKVYLTFKSMWENNKYKESIIHFFHEQKNPIKIQQHFLILLSKNVCKCNMHFCFFHFTNTYLVVWSKKKVQSTCVMEHYWFTRNNYHICISIIYYPPCLFVF